MSKIIAAVGILAGGAAAIFGLLNAFGIHTSSDQQQAISAVLGLLLAVTGVWFHPSIPVGEQAKKKAKP